MENTKKLIEDISASKVNTIIIEGKVKHLDADLV
jgi:hypothetical protein